MPLVEGGKQGWVVHSRVSWAWPRKGERAGPVWGNSLGRGWPWGVGTGTGVSRERTTSTPVLSLGLEELSGPGGVKGPPKSNSEAHHGPTSI